MRNLIATLCLLSTGIGTAQISFKVEPNHSNVGFAVPIAGGLTKVTGKFTAFETTIIYDEHDLTKSTVEVKIKTSSIDTGNDDRDQDLQSEDFFSTVSYPEIIFKSKRIENTETGLRVAGELTMRGVTKEVVLIAVVKESREKDGAFVLGVSAQTTVNRLDFGVGKNWQHTLIPNFLGNEVRVEIDMWTKPGKRF